MPEDLFLDTFVGDVPSPESSTSNEIPQEGLYNQYSSETAKEALVAYNRPFIHSFNSVPLGTEYYIVPEDIVIFYINVSLTSPGACTVSLNDATNIIIDGSIGGNFAIPAWIIRKGEKLYTAVINGGVHWVGIYLSK